MHTLAAVVASLTLPLGASYWAVEPSAGGLLVSGNSSRGSGCTWLTVDATKFAMRSRLHGGCARPPRATRPVVPVVVWNRGSQWQDIRLAHVGSTVTYGPVVLRYEDASDTRPQWAYGPGSLWLYDVLTTHGSQLLRFSATTGRLEQRVAMPKLFRPVIAADADGLWLVAAVNGGVSGQQAAALYHVAPDARTWAVVHREGRAAFWITAHGHTVWTGLVTGTHSVALWRFDGPNATPRLLLRERSVTATVATYGAGALWGVTPNGFPCTAERITRIDPNTGRETVVARLPALGGCGGLLFEPSGFTFFRGALYVLDGPRLYRVQP